MQAESPITVACIQMEPKIGERKPMWRTRWTRSPGQQARAHG
jgi:hypothetical protein